MQANNFYINGAVKLKPFSASFLSMKSEKFEKLTLFKIAASRKLSSMEGYF
jgi:hypothetical protein